MAQVTPQGIINILIGTELGGVQSRQYEVNLAVPNQYLGISRGSNNSGLSFGVVQFDIGNNSLATQAYSDILSNALQRGIINKSEFNQLIQYNGVKRPDLDVNLSGSYKTDMQFLEKNVFSQSDAKNIIDNYTNLYVSMTLHPIVDTFLDTMYAQYGSGTVFDPLHPDFHTAVATITSMANRLGNLGSQNASGSWSGTTGYFLNPRNAPMALTDVKARYDIVLGDHWGLVQIGGSLYRSSGQLCFLESTIISMWPLDIKENAAGLYDENEILAKAWKKSIEEITPSDQVLSFDKNNNLKPGKVVRTFRNKTKVILDFNGTFVTPDHIYFREDSKGPNKFEALIDILRDDGIIRHQDGTLIRASTGCEVGSEDDEQFWAFTIDQIEGGERVRDKKRLRLGTRWMLPNGQHFSMREYMEGIHIELIREGKLKGYVRHKKHGYITIFIWTFSETLPNAEDFMLQRSNILSKTGSIN